MKIIAILNNIRSIHNVASMFRTADGAGIAKMYLVGITPGPVDVFGRPREQFAKVSLGAESVMRFERARSLSALMRQLKKEGVMIFGIEQDAHALPYTSWKTALPSRKNNQTVAFVVGEEVKGLTKSAMKACDHILEIPMRGRKESLNVSVAFGIIAYELTK